MGTRADTFFGGMDKEISEKRDLFVHRSASENFQWEIFSGGGPMKSLRTHPSEYVYLRRRRHISVRAIPARVILRVRIPVT